MDNMGKSVLSIIGICQWYFKVQKSAFKGQYGSSRIVSWFELVEILSNNMYIKAYVLLMKIDQFILRRRFASNRFTSALIQNIFKSLK